MKTQYNETMDLVNGLKSASGLSELTPDSLKALLSKNSKGGQEIDTLTNQIKELQDLNQKVTGDFDLFKQGADKKAFELAVSSSDIFANVSSDPFLRSAVLSAVTPKLVVGDDGGLYAKGQDGGIMLDIVSNKPIKGADLFNQMVESGAISKTAINGSIGSGAGGSNNSQGGGAVNTSRDVSKMSMAEKATLMKDMGNDEYLKLAQSQLNKGK